MSEWLQTTLGRVLSSGGGKIQTGPFGSQLHASDYVESGIPCIMPANMHNNRVNLSGIAFIGDKDAQRLSHHLVQEGDIVYSRRGDVTQKALIGKTEAGYFCGTGCLLVRPGNAIDPAFLTYHLSTPTNQGWIVKQAVGATMPNLNTAILSAVPLSMPPLKETQKKIAAVLSALDAKIDCNNRINAELEAMAKTLYDYWFVQFDFPGANGKPYKSSGGKMAYNATLKREIPVGWRDGTIGNLISLEYGKGLKAENRTGSGHPVIGSNGVVGYHSEYLVEGPGIVVGRKGTVGAITFIHTDFFPIDTTYYVKPISKIGFLYLKYLLSSLGLEKMNSDSAVPGLNREVALRINTVLPPTTLIQDFERRTAAVFSKLHILVQENQQLAQLRDWLLPLLMNGQVTVAGRRPA
ncbi:MAG: restriction endonuclease subunit S [Rhodoferax sp.]|nr:restriction endonuclease subunit S [Rhodoferax sp.]